MDPKELLDKLGDEAIVAAIHRAEARSRGEIRVHVTSEAVGDAQGAASEVFVRLGMAKTVERNGVLIYVSPRAQTFAIIGDRGVHERCGEEFWKEVAAAMQTAFRAGRYRDGVLLGIERAGDVLARHFPRLEGVEDKNELPDEVSRD
jgi:uncharacterized membrane protein